MLITSVKQAIQAAEHLQSLTPKGKRIHWPVAFKKALCTFLREESLKDKPKSKVTANYLGARLPMSDSTIYVWIEQFNQGLYESDAVYSVSKKSVSAVKSIRQVLEQDIENLQKKLALVSECEALGLKVSL